MKSESSSTRSPHSIFKSLVCPEGLALSTLLCATSLQAQTPAAPAAPAAANLPEVVVEGQREAANYKPEALSSPKITQPLRDVPQTVSVIPKAVMQEQGATTLRDVLRNVPGISMQAGEGGGGLPGDNLSIRGFNARSDMYIDGVRDYGAYSRDPFNVEQVEVAKGPASTNSGRGSTGGSINLVSKAPKLDSFYEGTIGGGTDGYFRTTIDINQPLWINEPAPVSAPTGKQPVGKASIGKAPKGPVPAASSGHATGAAFRLNGLYHQSDMPGREDVESERWAIAPSVTFGLGTPTRLTFNYMHMEQDNVPDYGIPWVPANTHPFLRRYSDKAAPVSFGNFYGLRDYDFEDITTDVAGLLLEHDFSDDVRLRNFTRYGRTHRDSAITAPRFVDANKGFQINRQLQRRELTNELWANQTDLTLQFDTGPVKHTLVTGLEFAREEQDNKNSAQAINQPQTNLFNPDPSDRPLGAMPPITRTAPATATAPATRVGIPNTATADTISAYLFDTAKLSEQWELTGGVRYDHLKSEYESAGLPFDRTDDMFSWRTALVFKPVEHGSIYAGYGTSFNTSIDGNTGLALAANNVNLDPEETRTLELGTKWDILEERLSLTAAVFHTEKTNARTSDPTDPAAITVLDGEQEVQGIELGFTGNITEWWRVYGGYTHLSSEIKASRNKDEVGKELSNTPENSFSLWTVFDLPGGFQLGGGTQFVDTRFNNNINQRQAPSYWLFDAMMSYKITENVSLSLNVYNLADEEYIDRLGGGHFVPGAGRSASLTMNVKF